MFDRTPLIADLRPVKLGQRHGDLVAIDEGLSAGETVIMAGRMLFPGAKVSLQTTTAEAKPVASTPDGKNDKAEAQAK